MSLIYFEGNFIEESEGKIPLTDRGFQCGDGAFAVVQVRRGVPLFLDTHLEQLQKNAQNLNILHKTIDQAVIDRLISLNGANEGIWRLKILITGGDTPETRLPLREGRVAAFLKPFHLPPVKPLKMELFPIPYYCCHGFFKSLAHLNRFYVMEEAFKKEVDDCITRTEGGIMLEAAYGNLFWVKEKTFMTPDPSLPINFGVTIRNTIKLAHKMGFDVRYVKTTLEDIPTGSTLFRTNTMHGVRPVAQIQEKSFAQNGVIQDLFMGGYEDLMEREIRNYTAHPILPG